MGKIAFLVVGVVVALGVTRAPPGAGETPSGPASARVVEHDEQHPPAPAPPVTDETVEKLGEAGGEIWHTLRPVLVVVAAHAWDAVTGILRSAAIQILHEIESSEDAEVSSESRARPRV